MAGLNKMAIIGFLGRDVEVRQTQDGLTIANFSVAVSEKIKGQDSTLWFKIAAFGKLGEICSQYLSKGQQVYIEGRLQTSEWEDREGNKRFSLEIVANQMVMLGSKGDNQPPQAAPPKPPQQQPAGQQAPAPKEDNEIPF